MGPSSLVAHDGFEAVNGEFFPFPRKAVGRIDANAMSVGGVNARGVNKPPPRLASLADPPRAFRGEGIIARLTPPA